MFQTKAKDGSDRALLLPEVTDARILEAAAILHERRVANILLPGKPEDIETAAAAASVSLEGMTVIDPASSDQLDEFTDRYCEMRPGTRPSIARRLVAKPLFFAGSMLKAGQADAMLAGAATTTARVVEACLMTVGLDKDVKTPSSSFLMLLPAGEGGAPQPLIFADCAMNIDPGVDELADIAIASAATAKRLLSSEPRVAFLSFSTRGSGKHALARKMADAAKRAAERAPELAIDGELQADAALSERVAGLKMADIGAVAGRANVLIFPDLNAANIAYKLTEQLARAKAIGPMLQGFARPVADLSRGATVDDIVETAVVVLNGYRAG